MDRLRAAATLHDETTLFVGMRFNASKRTRELFRMIDLAYFAGSRFQVRCTTPTSELDGQRWTDKDMTLHDGAKFTTAAQHLVVFPVDVISRCCQRAGAPSALTT